VGAGTAAGDDKSALTIAAELGFAKAILALRKAGANPIRRTTPD